MKKTAIRLTVLSIILLVSISGIVLGANNSAGSNGGGWGTVNETIAGATVTPTYTATGTNVDTSTTNTTKTSTMTNTSTTTNTSNATVTNTDVQVTTAPTPEETVATQAPTPQETSTPQAPVQTPKSPGFESVVSAAVLLLAMYVSKRK